MEKIYIYMSRSSEQSIEKLLYASVFCESGYSLPIDIKDLPETMV